MKNLKRVLAMVLALVMVLSFAGCNNFVGARADSFDSSLVNQFTDIKGHWASDGLTNLIGYGYMRGVGDNKAAPNETITTAQLVALLVRIMGGSEEADLSGYADMDPKAWYYSEMAQGLNMGIVPNTNTNYLNPRQEASREYAAYMLCRAFGLTVREPIEDYADADKVSDWAVSSMQAMVAAEAIVGTEGRTGRYLNPQESITRAEFAQMIYRLNRDFVKDSDSTSISRQTFDNGLLISKSGVTLTDCTIKGNLYIADAVGRGDVTLKDVKVEGNIYARGAGDRSVHLEGATTANSVVMINPYMATRLVVGEDVKINGVLVNNGKDKVTLEGPVGNVTVNVSDVDLDLSDATATNVIINSKNSVITVDKDSVVETLSIASSSSGAKIESKGTVKRLALMANSAELNLSGTLDYLLIGAVSDLKLDLDSSIKLGALDLHCSDSTITVNSEVKSISVSAFSEKLKLELGKSADVVTVGIASSSADLSVHSDAKIGSVTIDAPKYKGTISSTLTNLTIGAGATEAEITLDSSSTITNMFVNAEKAKVKVESKATVKDLNVTGKEVTIEGAGTVERVNAAITAEKLTVTTGNTAVANAGAEKVTAGGIEVPAGKTYVTTSDGKDVIRNNDGTPDGDGDKTTGADQEIATVANFELAFAKDAQADDIHSSRNWVLSNLVENVTFEKNTQKGAAYVLKGNVKKVENFTPVYDPIAGYGTGYYVPVVVSAEFMEKETDWTVTVNGQTYNKNNLSNGLGYKGKLIVFLQLSQGTSTRVTTVTVDRDGAGTKYSPVTVGIDYTGVTFDGVQDFSSELFSYPTRAAKDDLTTDGSLALSDFGTATIIKTADNTYAVSGEANYIDATVLGNIAGIANTTVNHYVPVMVNVTGFTQGWSVVTENGARFNASNVSNGTGCKGNLILLLGVSAGKTSQTIYIDRDGDGRSDASYILNTVSVNCKAQGPATPDPIVETRLSYPSGANSGDLYNTGVSKVSDLGTYGLSLKHLNGDNNVLLTGGAAALQNAPSLNTTSPAGTYYYPILVDTSDFTNNWSVSTSIGGKFDRSNVVPYGGNYYGKLIIFIALPEPSRITRFATINIDKDGNGVTDETWNLYSDVTLGTSVTDPETNVPAGLFKLATNGNATDFAGSGLTTMADFGTFTATEVATNNKTQVAYKISGTANYLESVGGNIQHEYAHHYVPVVIDLSTFSGNWYVNCVTGNTFTAADVVKQGGAYWGKLVIFVDMFHAEDDDESDYTALIMIDSDGDDEPNYSIRLTDNVTCTPKEVEDYGKVPDGVTITLDTKVYTIDVLDKNGALYTQLGEIKKDELIRSVKAHMLTAGYENLHETTSGNVITFKGTKGGLEQTFTCDMSTSVNKAFNVVVNIPNSASAYTVPQGRPTTVKAVLDTLKEQVKYEDTYLGNYYFIGTVGENPLPISGAAEQTITADTVIYVGYYKVTVPETTTAVAEGLTAVLNAKVPVDYNADANTDVFYVRYNDTIEMSVSVAGTTTKAGGTIVLSGEGVTWTEKSVPTDEVKAVTVATATGTVTFTTAYDADTDAGYEVVAGTAWVYTHPVTADATYTLTGTAAE